MLDTRLWMLDLINQQQGSSIQYHFDTIFDKRILQKKFY